MRINDFIARGINKTPKDELRNSFSRYEDNNFSKAFSLKGRGVCLLVLPLHILGIIGKPLCYAAGAMVATAATIVLSIAILIKKMAGSDVSNLQTSWENELKTALGFTANVIVSPIGQIAQAAKSAAGIFHPAAYFKNEGPVITSRLPPPPPPRRPNRFTFNPNLNPFNSGHGEAEVRVPRFVDLRDNVIGVLVLLSQAVRDTNPANIRVHYGDQLGVDAGGLRKDFIYRLFHELSTVYDLQNTIPRWSNAYHDTLTDIGTSLKFLLRGIDYQSVSELPLGDVFSSAFFKGLLSLTHQETVGAFDQISDERLLEILCTVTEDPAQLQILRSLQSAMRWDGNRATDPNQTHLNALRNACINIYFIDFPAVITPQELARVNAEILEEVIHPRRAELQSLHAVSQGMGCSEEQWLHLVDVGPEAVAEHIHGPFSKDALKNALHFDNQATEQRKQEIRAWMDDKTDEELKRFLACVTGAAAIPQGGIQIWTTYRGDAAVHSCFNRIDIPIDHPALRVVLDSYCQEAGFNIA